MMVVDHRHFVSEPNRVAGRRFVFEPTRLQLVAATPIALVAQPSTVSVVEQQIASVALFVMINFCSYLLISFLDACVARCKLKTQCPIQRLHTQESSKKEFEEILRTR